MVSSVGKEPLTCIKDVVKEDQFDLHVWIIHNGKVIDYDDKVISNSACLYPTDKIVRRPFDVKLQKELMPLIKKKYNEKVTIIRGWDITQAKREVKVWKKTLGYCSVKAIMYKQKYPEAEIVIGSLGFVQKDGSIFWEFG